MIISPSISLAMIPQFAQAVGCSSAIFGPILGLLGFAAVLMCCAWILSNPLPNQAFRTSVPYYPQYNLYQPLQHRSSTIHHHGYDHGRTRIHGHS